MLLSYRLIALFVFKDFTSFSSSTFLSFLGLTTAIGKGRGGTGRLVAAEGLRDLGFDFINLFFAC